MSKEIWIVDCGESGAKMTEYLEPEHEEIREISKGFFPNWYYISGRNRLTSKMFDIVNTETKTKRLKQYYELCYKLWYKKYTQTNEFDFKNPDINNFCDYQIKYETDYYNKAKDIYKNYFKADFPEYENVYFEFIRLLKEKKTNKRSNLA